MVVIKRDGKEEDFNQEKIINAVLLAFQEVDKTVSEEALDIATKISDFIAKKKRKKITVEEIQDIVEEKLMKTNRKDVAKSYITYRYHRSLARDRYKTLISKVEEKIDCSSIENQNANVDEFSFGGRVGAASDVVMKEYALDHCMSEMARNNHLNNEIYIHDLNSYAVGCHNCLTLPIDHLLKNGFNTRQIDVRPAQSINTAMQLVAVLFQIQSLQQFGGVAASHIDWSMVPYVRRSFFKHWKDGRKYILQDSDADNLVFFEDKSIEDEYYKDGAYDYAMAMTVKETHQAVEGMYHNLKIIGATK